MRRCSWCGKEYPDEFERCPIDAEPLGSGEMAGLSVPSVETLPGPPIIAPQPRSIPSMLVGPRLSDRQLRIFEIVLLCSIAFGGSILYAIQHIPGLLSSSPTATSRSWLYSSVHEISALALLWYILLRRARSLSDLGFSWVNKDVVRSLLVWLAGSAAFSLIYGTLYLSGLTSVRNSTASAQVGHILFGKGVTPVAIVFQFINPFFEELIVRAFLMTEIRELTGSASKAVLLSVLIQTSYHFYQGAPMAIGEGATFLIFSLYYAKTNRITPVILAHMYMDVLATIGYMLAHR